MERITYEQARKDVVRYLKRQTDSYFFERDTDKEEVLHNNALIGILASEHQHCVNSYGNERMWSCQDACDNEPGIWHGKVMDIDPDKGF